MVTKGLIARLEAKAGKEEELAAFLRDALPIVQGEPQTIAWFALRAARRRSRSSTSSPTRPGVKRTSTGRSPQP